MVYSTTTKTCTERRLKIFERKVLNWFVGFEIGKRFYSYKGRLEIEPPLDFDN